MTPVESVKRQEETSTTIQFGRYWLTVAQTERLLVLADELNLCPKRAFQLMMDEDLRELHQDASR